TRSTRDWSSDVCSSDLILRVIVALAGVHALHPRQIRALQLADIDLPNRRLRTSDSDRPLDEHTAAAVDDYLTYRRARWPRTANRSEERRVGKAPTALRC